MLRSLPDSRVFSRDPETWDAESLSDAGKRLAKIVEQLKRVAGERGLDKKVDAPHVQLDLLHDVKFVS